jgi:hypothetical protein
VSGFSVKPDALDTYSKVLSDLTVDHGLERKYLIDASGYADKWIKLDGGQGGLIFQAIVGKTNDIHQELITENSLITTTLGESASGLTSSAAEYRKHDLGSAQRIDSVYKPGGVVPLDFSVDDTQPLADPSAKLVEPGEDGAVPDMVQQILDGAGYFSESDLVFKILNWCGLDVMGWVKEKFLGDFAAIARVKNAIQRLAEFDEVAATGIAEGADIMLKSWTGNAADAARAYFDQLANAVEGRSAALKALSSRYTAVLVGVQQAGSAIEGGITAAIDAAVEAAAAVAAAGCLQEVPGLDVLMDIIGAWRVTKVINKVHEVFNIWNITWSSHEGLMGAIAGLVGILGDYHLTGKLPKLGYYNASQGPAPNYDDRDDVPHGTGPK